MTSSFGNGFSASGGVSETTGAPLGLTFMFDATATLSIVLDSDSTPSDAGRSFFFEEAGVGGIGFFEPNLLSSRFTRNPSAINGNSFTVRFAREDGGIDPGTTVVPLPGPLGLLFGALAGLGWVLRRRTA